MSYYERNKEALITRQLAYHREHREERIAFMKEYNKKYWLANRPEPRPKKEKKVKEPRPPKEKKVKPPKEKKPKPNYDFVVPIYTYPTKIIHSNFILSFD
jgi:hypothetical protein